MAKPLKRPRDVNRLASIEELVSLLDVESQAAIGRGDFKRGKYKTKQDSD